MCGILGNVDGPWIERHKDCIVVDGEDSIDNARPVAGEAEVGSVNCSLLGLSGDKDHGYIDLGSSSGDLSGSIVVGDSLNLREAFEGTEADSCQRIDEVLLWRGDIHTVSLGRKKREERASL